MTIGELNIKVEIRHYTSVKNDEGKITSSLTDSWEKWASVTQTNGSRVLDQAAITYKETYKVVTRFEASRPTSSNYKLFYVKEMTIHSVVKEQIGKAWFETIIAYA